MSDNEQAPKYAGKFDTIEQLEEGYKNSAKVYQENENLKKQLEGYNAPDDYLKPANVDVSEAEIEDIKAIAKNSNLTQAQFEKLVQETQVRSQRRIKSLEEKRKAIGDEQYSVMQDYVSKYYPPEVADTILNKLVVDDKARAAALSHRDKALNTAVPGMNKINPASYRIEYDDVLKARTAHEGNRGSINLRNKYINLLAAYTSQNKDA